MAEAMCGSPAIIIDPGSTTLKAGFSGDDRPRFEFPSVVGRPKIKDLPGCEFLDHYIGDDAIAKRGLLNVKYPVEYRVVCNYDDMELILHHTMNDKLRVDPKENPVMVIEPALVPRASREKMTQIMFEVLDVPYFCLQNSAVLSLFSTGRTSGAVVESGDGVTHTSVVYEGHTLRYTIPKGVMAGRDVTYKLMSLLVKMGGFDFSTRADFDIVRDIKENICCVSEDYKGDLHAAKTSDKFSTVYKLPDGRTIRLTEERFRCCELLFSSDDDDDGGYDYYHGSMPELLNITLNKVDSELRRLAYSNIVLAGGNTLFPGFAERLTKDMSALIPAPKVIAPPERKYAPWIGGSIMTLLPTMKDNWVTKAEYEETGPDIVNRKCF